MVRDGIGCRRGAGVTAAVSQDVQDRLDDDPVLRSDRDHLDADPLPLALARHLIGLPPAALEDGAKRRQVRRRPERADRLGGPYAATGHRAPSPHSATATAL